MKIKLLFIVGLCALVSTQANAQQNTVAQDTAPIQEVSIRASASVNPLRLKTIMSLPDKLKTVKETTEYLLEPIAYKLVLSPGSENDSKRILARPFLKLNNDGSLKSIEDALLKISGDDTILVVDHEHKLITLEFVDSNTK